MSLITDNTKLKLLNNLANTPTANADDLLFIQRSLKSYNMKYEQFVKTLPDNSTLEENSNKLRIKDGGVTTTKIADNNVSLGKLSEIASNNRLLGNVSGTNQDVELVEIESSVSGAADKVVNSAGIQSYVTTEISNISNTLIGIKAFGVYTLNTGNIVGSGINSVVKNNIGTFTITMDTAAPDTNYTIIGMGEGDAGSAGVHSGTMHVDADYSKTTTTFRVKFRNANTGVLNDPIKFHISVIY